MIKYRSQLDLGELAARGVRVSGMPKACFSRSEASWAIFPGQAGPYPYPRRENAPSTPPARLNGILGSGLEANSGNG